MMDEGKGQLMVHGEWFTVNGSWFMVKGGWLWLVTNKKYENNCLNQNKYGKD
jgi:hypothetical protein